MNGGRTCNGPVMWADDYGEAWTSLVQCEPSSDDVEIVLINRERVKNVF